ncbi:MAG: PQQ-binding-like beta-propeller repeat protein, partial [Acidobacteria bacterium]|nr:PQQ-binding-like beta-propeller repeat protein [Acidobacteriota bacterium]
MPERHISLVVGVAAAVVVAALAAGLAAQAPEPGRGFPSTDWPFTGGNWSSSRYSTLDEINADTLDRLGAAWMTPLPGGAASRSTPVVQDGAIYLTGGANVFAFDARTGETIWHWQPDPDAGRVVSWQGVVVAGDLVVFGTRSGEVLALSRDAGELVWATRVGSPEQTRGEVVTTAPMYARGKVFVGLANGDIGGQGRVLALDAATGEVEWIFFVVPRPGEFGHETWPQDSDSWEYGGGGVWLVGTVDPDLGMVYFSTG